DGVQQRRRFDGVLIANGTLHKPNIPGLPGQFSGELMHSADYRSPEVFKGKRVLLVRCGNSGADIAVDAVHHAASVDLSLRRAYYFLPKFVRGRPIDTLGGKRPLPRPRQQRADAALVRMIFGKSSVSGLPASIYRLYAAHPVVNPLILLRPGHGNVLPRRYIAAIDGHRVRI